MKYFLCRFIPPSTALLRTATSQQKQLMKEHGEFLQALAEQGGIVAHGAVADPAGGWGLVLFEVDDTTTADDLYLVLAQDPMITAGFGARYEVLPMLNLHLRD